MSEEDRHTRLYVETVGDANVSQLRTMHEILESVKPGKVLKPGILAIAVIIATHLFLTK